SLTQVAQSQEFTVDANSQVVETLSLTEIASFLVLNSHGEVRIVESDGDQVELTADNNSNKEAKVKFVEVEPGKVLVEVVENNDVDIQIEGDGDVVIGNIVAGQGGSVVIGSNVQSASITNVSAGGKVSISIGGVDMSQEGGSSTTTIVSGGAGGVVQLSLSVPTALLANLRINSQTGDLVVRGTFENEASETRRISLETETGSIKCDGMCAMGSAKLRSEHGSVFAQGVRGPLVAETETDSITAIDNIGSQSLSTEQGKIVAINNIGDITAEAEVGSIVIQGHSQGSVEAKVDVGNITFDNPDAHSERGNADVGKVTYTENLKGSACGDEMAGKPNPKDDPWDF
ncbi:MAG: hypothetical protein AAF202_07500, partial [Pseudomonadota bacterium]